jgi:Protein of unknown function (DUF1566)
MAMFECLLALLSLSAALSVSAAPSGLLNDTGQNKCLNAEDKEDCNNNNTGSVSQIPGQDGRYGRDAAERVGILVKPSGSGGISGFAFKPLRADGSAIPLMLSDGRYVPSEPPRCVHDTVTNLVWEIKTSDGGWEDADKIYAWGSRFYSGGNTDMLISHVNSLNLCGETENDWRLPSRRELLSIINNERFGPALDVDYFINIPSGSMIFWSSDVSVPVSPPIVWVVDFDSGSSVSRNESSYSAYHAILVRDIP